jgi:plastocyanin
MQPLVILALIGRVFSGAEPAARPVVLLDPIGGPIAGAPAPSPRTAQLDEVWLSFVPKVQVVPPGSTLVFRARDADSHTVHAWYGGQTLFNRASVPHEPEQRVVRDRPGLVKVTCDLHAEMRAWVLVSASAYSAVGDVDGSFRAEVPPGRYRVQVWRPGDPAPELVGERELGPEALELHLSARTNEQPTITNTPAAPIVQDKAPQLPEWMRQIAARKSWPSGNLAYVLSIVGAPVGFALAWALYLLGARRRWSTATCVIFGCALAFGLGALSVAGLSAAVATGLGFGAFMGTVLVGAQRVSLR